MNLKINTLSNRLMPPMINAIDNRWMELTNRKYHHVENTKMMTGMQKYKSFQVATANQNASEHGSLVNGASLDMVPYHGYRAVLTNLARVTMERP